MHGSRPEDVISTLVPLATTRDLTKLSDEVARLDGHFALLLRGDGWQLGVVDQIRSSPIFFGPGAVDVCPERVAHGPEVNPLGALALAMSGFTIGGDTLYRQLSQLRPGELVFWDGHETHVRRYATFAPWRIQEASEKELTEELDTVMARVIEKLIVSASGRPIAVPLSAGLDSRLVLSGLKTRGYEPLAAFSYGQPGNFEAQVARDIATRLDVPWTFVPFTWARQRAEFGRPEYRSYLRYSDTRSSTPFHQDYGAIRRLRDEKRIAQDTIIVNGNSGDFITGNHIPDSLHDPKASRQAATGALLQKHYRLWRDLATPANDDAIAEHIEREWTYAGLEDQDVAAFALYEYAEFQDRQCKYVVNGQRVYEHLGLDWRLPLWDVELLRFFERVPLEFKARQRLYRAWLQRADWGGVWDRLDHPRTMAPRWIVPIYYAALAAYRALGGKDWLDVERRYFRYWMDVVMNYACFSYLTVARDRRGFQNAIAWHTQRYLDERGISTLPPSIDALR